MEKSIFTREHKAVVERLVKARKEAGLNQEEVAKALGKTQSYISKIESGQRRLDVVQLKELAEVYRKRIDYFIR